MPDATSPAHATVFTSPRAEARLDRAAAWLAAGGRDREVLVVGATTLAARTLVRQATAAGGATFGWRATTLGRLALTLAMPRLVDDEDAAAGRTIVEGLCVRVLFRLREAGELGRLGPIADRPGLARAVAETVHELRLAGTSAEALAEQAPELARVLTGFEQLLRDEHLADRAAILRLATRAAAALPQRTPLLLLDVPVASALEAGFVGALAGGAVLATVPAGEQRTLDHLRDRLPNATIDHDNDRPPGALPRLQATLFAESAAAPAARGDDVVFLSAPGESRECVEIARRIAREAEAGVPFDRMAVLLRAPAQYRAHLQEALRRARIPVHFASGAVQPDPAGRAFLALLTCREEGLSARRFAEYLSLGEAPNATAASEPPPAVPDTDRWVPPDEELMPAVLAEDSGDATSDDIPDATTDPASSEATPAAEAAVVAGTLRAPQRWEQLLVDAAVIGGRARWERRLDGLRAELTAKLHDLKTEETRAEAYRRDLASLATLRAFALPILRDLEDLPAKASWGDWLERLSALATRTLRWPDRVLAVLAELGPMAPVGPVSLPEVRTVLGRRLANLVLPPSPRTAGRVFIGPVAAARGLCFDVVFVPGLAERMFPQRVNQDPLLRDELRARLDPTLATLADQIEAERLQLRIAVGSARRRVVLSYSRIDAEQARPRVPSFYGLEVLRAVEGRLPSFEALARGAERGSATRLGWPAPANPADAIDEAEHDLALLDSLVRPAGAVTGAARYLITSNQHLARALRHRAMRFDPSRWSFADGLVKPDAAALAALGKHAFAERSYSPTALQSFAACPYRFVLYAIHKLQPRDEPIAIEKIDPLERGTLVHEILFRLFTELRDSGLGPLAPGNAERVRAALDRILPAVAADFRDRLAPAIDRVWEDGIASIRADLLEFLRREAERAPFVPWKLELAFGLHESGGRDPSSTTEPVKLDCGIKLRGSIDVVEHGHGLTPGDPGTLRATDHKTGKQYQRPGAVVGGGESLQPVFYSLVLEKLFPERVVAGGRLNYCTSAGDFKEVLVPLDARARDAANRVAAAIGTALTSGFLPAAPKKDACRYCDYRPVCGPWEEERVRKKRERGPLGGLEKLRELP